MQTKSIRPRHFAAALAVCGLLSHADPSIAASPDAKPKSLVGRGLNIKYMDQSVTPCQDFYRYANGHWLDTTPIPADQVQNGAGMEIYERNQVVLRQVVEAAAADTKAVPGSIAQKIGTFYRSGMDTARIESDGAKPLAPELRRINAIHDVDSLETEIAHLQRTGTEAAWSVGVGQDFKSSTDMIAQVGQGGLGLPDRDYYLNPDDSSKAIRKSYVQHIAKVLELAGDTPAAAAAGADRVMALETRLAKASMSNVERRDPVAMYHKMPISDLQTLAPGATWQTYFTAVGLPHPGDILVDNPRFFTELAHMMTDTPLDDWKSYLRWLLAATNAPYLSSAFVDENFHFTSTLMGVKEQRPRWKRVLGVVNAEMGEGVGKLYVAKAFSPEAKTRAVVMVKNLQGALRDRIQSLAWMGPDTKKEALKKLDHLIIKVGYPDKWRDYSKLTIDSPTYAANVAAAEDFEFQRELDKLGKPVDKTEWGLSPQTLNAYYNPQFNEIVFPAGILQAPLFDANADDAVNYGGIGMVIGHEMTHGFDDQGRQFDSDGNLRDWWTAEDAKNFDARGEQIVKQYSAYEPIPGTHINGKLEEGENIADSGGLKIAYLALQKALQGKPRPLVDGFTPEQRFFLGFAQGWRANTRPEALKMTLIRDPHAPNSFRVNGPIANMPEFAAAFHCPKAKEETLSIW